ncbi:unnamed protein product, partial [Coregonus sp. 'balchen']
MSFTLYPLSLAHLSPILCHIAVAVFDSKNRTWSSGQHYCRKKYTDLAFIENHSDIDEFLMVNSSFFGPVWIGLRRNVSCGENWQWSNGEKFQFEKWRQRECESVDEQGYWTRASCSEKKSFICQNLHNPSLVEEKKNWTEAFKHCHLSHTDLASVMSDAYNEKILEKLRNTSEVAVWIGLHHQPWRRSDLQPLSSNLTRELLTTESELLDKMGQSIQHGCHS